MAEKRARRLSLGLEDWSCPMLSGRMAALKDFNIAGLCGALDPSHPSINAVHVIHMKTPEK